MNNSLSAAVFWFAFFRWISFQCWWDWVAGFSLITMRITGKENKNIYCILFFRGCSKPMRRRECVLYLAVTRWLNTCRFPAIFWKISHAILDTLSSDDGNDNENVTLKIKLSFLCYFTIKFQSLLLQKRRTTKEPLKLGRVAFQLIKRMKNSPSCVHVLHETLIFLIFTLLFCRGRQRNVPTLETHVRSDCFCSLNLLFCGVAVAVAVVVA